MTFAYDEVPYDTEANVDTHPVAMATIAALAGLSPAAAARARILEIGCGDGANLSAMAAYLPSAKLVGFGGQIVFKCCAFAVGVTRCFAGLGVIRIAPGEGLRLHFLHEGLGNRQGLFANHRVGAVAGGEIEHTEHARQRHADDDDEYDQFEPPDSLVLAASSLKATIAAYDTISHGGDLSLAFEVVPEGGQGLRTRSAFSLIA